MSRGIDWVRPVRDANGELDWKHGIVCPPGTPAGPDPDRAEMLLAEGLAKLPGASTCDADDVADAIGAGFVGTTVHDCAWGGAYDALDSEQDDSEWAPDLDAYMAGAALAIAITQVAP